MTIWIYNEECEPAEDLRKASNFSWRRRLAPRKEVAGSSKSLANRSWLCNGRTLSWGSLGWTRLGYVAVEWYIVKCYKHFIATYPRGFYCGWVNTCSPGTIFSSRQQSQNVFPRNSLELTTSEKQCKAPLLGEIVSFPRVLCEVTLYNLCGPSTTSAS